MVTAMTHSLRIWLDEHSETQEAFAARVGISRMHLWRILNSGLPSRETALKIEAATGGTVTAISLLGLERRKDGVQ